MNVMLRTGVCCAVMLWAAAAGAAQSRGAKRSRAPARPPAPAIVPVVIASEQENARLLAQDGRTLFWVSSEGVMRADKAGGGARRLYEATDVADLGVIRDRIYWLERYAVKMAPTHGGEVTYVAKDRSQPERLTLDPAAAYWTEPRGDGAALVSMRRMASEVGEVMFPDAMPQHLVADGASIYFTDFNGNVFRIGKWGGPPDLLATDKFAPAGRLALDAKFVFWTNPSGQLVQRVSREGGKVATLFKGSGVPAAMALEPKNVLFALNDDAHAQYRVMRVPKRGGKARALLAAEGKIVELLLDRNTLYWIEESPTGRRVMKAKLPR